jgi:hypothetical protein
VSASHWIDALLGLVPSIRRPLLWLCLEQLWHNEHLWPWAAPASWVLLLASVIVLHFNPIEAREKRHVRRWCWYAKQPSSFSVSGSVAIRRKRFRGAIPVLVLLLHFVPGLPELTMDGVLCHDRHRRGCLRPSDAGLQRKILLLLSLLIIPERMATMAGSLSNRTSVLLVVIADATDATLAINNLCPVSEPEGDTTATFNGFTPLSGSGTQQASISRFKCTP